MNKYEPLEIKQILTQNKKMKNSTGIVYNWTIPAFKAKDGTVTCPNASKCVVGCYAKQGAYIWNNVSKVHNAKLSLTKLPDFDSIMINAIQSKLKKDKTVFIRIHDSGDFYSLDYTLTWFRIMKHFKGQNVKFYAYTKQVETFKDLKELIPDNFTVIFSYGGKQDNLINPETDRHSLVFESETELESQGYINASKDDLKAITQNHRVGLVYHGTKKYSNTTWNKVTVNEPIKGVA